MKIAKAILYLAVYAAKVFGLVELTLYMKSYLAGFAAAFAVSIGFFAVRDRFAIDVRESDEWTELATARREVLWNIAFGFFWCALFVFQIYSNLPLTFTTAVFMVLTGLNVGLALNQAITRRHILFWTTNQ